MGLHSLVAITRFHQLPAEPEQLQHQFTQPDDSFGDTQRLQAAKVLGGVFMEAQQLMLIVPNKEIK